MGDVEDFGLRSEGEREMSMQLAVDSKRVLEERGRGEWCSAP